MNVGIRAASGDYLLILDADDCVSPRFIELAVRALERRPEFDVVVPSPGYFQTDAELADGKFSGWAVFLGDAHSLGLVSNRLGGAMTLLRRSLFEECAYDEALDSYEDWALYLRLALAGKRFLVTNDVHFHYRRRAGSMISAMTPQRHLSLLQRILGAVKMIPASTKLFVCLAAAPREVAATPPPPRPLRYDLADKLNAAMKKVPLIHPLLKAAFSRSGPSR